MKHIIYMTCFLLCLASLTACTSRRRSPKTTAEATASSDIRAQADFRGAIKTVDQEEKKILVYNINMEREEEYTYSGGTEILSQNDREMTMAEVEQGQVYEFFYTENREKLAKMYECADIVEEEETRITLDSALKQITVDETTYAYTDNLVVVSEGKILDPMEIQASDQVTLRAVKGLAYSLVVTKGHGYIEPTGCEDFVGGSLIVEGEAILPVSEGMLLTVPEGTQKLS
ncbi:MAG: hypothetical protein K6G62_07655, partial [Eubacterium sp.]|nr:hypothetical protein [Eubacterium sp.]